MKLEDIFFHDCTLVRVIEVPARDILALEVEFPIDWEANVFAPKTILFSDVLRYEVDEGPFLGAPVILEYSAEPDGARTRITMRTNAGRRAVSFGSVDLVDGHNATGDAGYQALEAAEPPRGLSELGIVWRRRSGRSRWRSAGSQLKRDPLDAQWRHDQH